VLYGEKRRSANKHSEDQYLSEASKWLRDQGLVPWQWIVDETRSLSAYLYADSVSRYLLDAVADARINCWRDEPPPLIICESRTFAGVLRRTLAPDYLTPVTATNGQVGGFLHTNVASVLDDNERRVLYVGDLDRRGGMIEANTRRVLGEAAERDFDGDRWRRVALTQAQVQAHGLPVVSKWDGALRQHFDAVEVEALGQGVVTEIIRATLDALLPESLVDVLTREERQRRQARAQLRGQT
jgi:hypothetical protein